MRLCNGEEENVLRSFAAARLEKRERSWVACGHDESHESYIVACGDLIVDFVNSMNLV